MGFNKSSSSSLATYLLRNDAGSSRQSYGTIKQSSPVRTASTSPWRERERPSRIYDLEDVTDDDDEDEVEELIDIPYGQLMRNFALVPIASFLMLILFACLLTFCWPPPPHSHHEPYPYHPHWPEFLTGCAAWIVSYSLRIPIFILSTFGGRYTNAFSLTASATFHTAIEEGLRLASIMILQIRLSYWQDHPDWIPYPDTQDDAFRQVFWFALGWALVEVVWSIAQGYEQLALYRDVLDGERDKTKWETGSDDDAEVESISHRFVHSAFKSVTPPEHSPYGQSRSLSILDPRANGHQVNLDSEMTQLINIQSRTELESVYGVPPPNIPVFIFILQRLDAMLLTIGLTLIVSSTYLSELIAHPLTQLPSHHPSSPEPDFPPRPDVVAAALGTVPMYIILVLVHASLAMMWTEALPKIGIHTASYTALLIALGVFFVGLASWGALS